MQYDFLCLHYACTMKMIKCFNRMKRLIFDGFIKDEWMLQYWNDDNQIFTSICPET